MCDGVAHSGSEDTVTGSSFSRDTLSGKLWDSAHQKPFPDWSSNDWLLVVSEGECGNTGFWLVRPLFLEL